MPDPWPTGFKAFSGSTGCSKRALPLLVIATLSLTACATAPSRPGVVCPPVAAYDRAFLARLADEIQRLPPGAALERALSDAQRARMRAAYRAAGPVAVQGFRTVLEAMMDPEQRRQYQGLKESGA